MIVIRNHQIEIRNSKNFMVSCGKQSTPKAKIDTTSFPNAPLSYMPCCFQYRTLWFICPQRTIWPNTWVNFFICLLPWIMVEQKTLLYQKTTLCYVLIFSSTFFNQNYSLKSVQQQTTKTLPQHLSGSKISVLSPLSRWISLRRSDLCLHTPWEMKPSMSRILWRVF